MDLISLSFLLSFLPPPSLGGNKKNSLPCRQRDTLPFAKENLSFQSPGVQRAPKFPLHPPVEGGGCLDACLPDLEVLPRISIFTEPEPWNIVCSPATTSGGCGDILTTDVVATCRGLSARSRLQIQLKFSGSEQPTEWGWGGGLFQAFSV